LAPDVEGLDTPVYVLVLEKFGIPFVGGPSTGVLPGMDIKRMSAVDAIRLSLAESLINGEWWDIYEDGSGGVYFEKVFSSSGDVSEPINLDIRQCIPSAEKTNEVDLVIVRGYDSPAIREVRPFKDVVPAGLGEINPLDIFGTETLFTVAPSELLSSSCHSRLTLNEVYKSYRDPVQTDAYHPQEEAPFYDVKAFEKVIGYVQRVTGMPSDPSEAARVKYEFRTSTPWYKPIQFPTMTKTTTPGCAGPGVAVANNIQYVEGSFQYQSPDYNDRYGTPWPLVNKPAGIFFTGNKLISIVDLSAASALTASLSAPVIAYVGPIKELKAVDNGATWVWNHAGRGLFDISIYFQLQNIGQEIMWDTIVASMGQTALVKYSDGASFDANEFGSYGSSTRTLYVMAGPGDLGYLVEDMWLALDLDRPCVVITDVEGDALGFADRFRLESAPIIVIDTPAPIAYYDGTEGKIVDQADTLQDSDPTTQQNFEVSELEQLQDRMQGNVIDISLPFCNEDQCLVAAETIYNYMHHAGVQTYSLTCGPSSEPRLGARVAGYGDEVVIDSIDYSFNDGGSYNINVNLAPVFINIGSWNSSTWTKQVEDVERSAIIRWVAGDGVNYRVEVQGLGMYNAVNGTQLVFYVGETVSVRINNNPVEV
jgi:hypothetical protein